MRGLARIGLLMTLVQLTMAIPCNAQANAVRVDALGPVLYITYLADKTPWRLGAEYQRLIHRNNYSWVGFGVEYMQYHEQFRKLWNYLPPYPTVYREWNEGSIRTNQFSLIVQTRFELPIGSSAIPSWSIFVSPQIGLSWRWGRIQAFLSDGSCCDHDVREFGLTPRLRTGFHLQPSRAWGVEISCEFIYQKLLGSQTHKWMLLPSAHLELRI